MNLKILSNLRIHLLKVSALVKRFYLPCRPHSCAKLASIDAQRCESGSQELPHRADRPSWMVRTCICTIAYIYCQKWIEIQPYLVNSSFLPNSLL